jgi:Mtf2 family
MRRQAMTAREISAFDEMFNMIFYAASEQNGDGSRGDRLDEVSIGRRKMGDLFGRLRRHSKRLKWTSESDELLDRKKEEMELCDTDQQLLDWALREVFGESKRYEEAARKAVAEAAASGSEAEALPMLQPETYPHLVAHLMRAFRDKYNDPHLALSIFDHARHLSIPSYVFGCTTPAYNELIETRWRCFRDLKGVHDALEEMIVNGVEPDNRTRKVVETLRREVGERNLWEEESDLGSGEVWAMLAKIESLMVTEAKEYQEIRPSTRYKGRWTPSDEQWKRAALHPQAKDGWEFGQWEDKKVTPQDDLSAQTHDRNDDRLLF